MTSQIQSSSRRNNRRRRLLVDKPFQYRLITLLLAIWAVNSMFFSIILYYFYQGHILYFYDLVLRPGKAPLVSAPLLFAVAIGFIIVFGLIILAIIGMYLSNQIAGPLYRLKMSINRVSEGDVNFEVRFREGDFLRDFPGHFNHMLRTLKEHGMADIQALRAAEAALSDVGKARALLQDLREKKESRLGIPSEPRDSAGKSEPAAQAVH